MKCLKENIVKGWITSAIGTILMVTSLFLWFTGVIPLIWEGTVGLALGCLLLLSPKTIEKNVGKIIGAWGGNSSSCDPPIEPKPPEDGENNSGQNSPPTPKSKGRG